MSRTVHSLALPYHSDSLGYFESLRSLGYGVLFDSNSVATRGRYDIISAAPVAIIEHKGNPESVFAEIRAQIETHCSGLPLSTPLPFVSGAIALFSYDFGEQLQGIQRERSGEWPALHAGIYQWALVQDHALQRATLVADPKIDLVLWQAICDRTTQTEPDGGEQTDFALQSHWRSNLDADSYALRFALTRDYIHAGDSYQVNLAQRHEASYQGDPWQAYRRLRKQSPTPYAAFIERPEGAVASLSPERFIAVEDRGVTTEPIKGTSVRSKDPDIDRQQRLQLQHSTKDRAENLMIVDLMRNDLGRNCATGSIRAPELFTIASFANVHHMISKVTGKLRDDADALDLVRDAMPGGSITGAPKFRSMQIIAELEPDSRSVYCGNLAWFDSRGNSESNILIRTLLFENSETDPQGEAKVYCWGGGGIVADSTCAEEYQESIDKVENLLDALRLSAVEETASERETADAS